MLSTEDKQIIGTIIFPLFFVMLFLFPGFVTFILTTFGAFKFGGVMGNMMFAVE